MTDIAPALFEKLNDAFEEEIRASGLLAKLEAKNRSGKTTHEDALRYAQAVGDILQKVFRENIKSEELPDGMLYYNIGERTVKPLMVAAYERISAYTAKVQDNLNKKARIGLKAVVPEVNMDRIEGIIGMLSDGE